MYFHGYSPLASVGMTNLGQNVNILAFYCFPKSFDEQSIMTSQIRRSCSAQGLLRLLSATTTKIYRKLNRPTKGAHIISRTLSTKRWLLVDRNTKQPGFYVEPSLSAI